MKTAEEFVTFGQGNVEALVKSSQVVASGMQDITKQLAAAMQASLDETMTTFRAMAGVRSIKEAIDLQTTLARNTVEKTLTQTSHVADASFKIAEQAIAPIAGRVSLAVDRIGRSA